ncbi:MAG: phosphate ABC transporter permease subunit PstC [Methanoregula sp.]|jgi:phosphate transport system permease protein|nr:phosphate ABC transporter permease subunit PstC [Methanoregula sp.]
MPDQIDTPKYVFLACGLITAALVIFVFGFILLTAAPVLQKEGISFITGTTWDYDTHQYGILIFILGTIYLTVVTMILAIPLGVFTAIFLAELAPAWLEKIIRPLLDLLVGIPSVVYGIFGFFVLEGIFRNAIDPAISDTLGFIPIFYDPDPGSGLGILLGATILTLMILPTIVAISQESIRSIPDSYREASLALGATKWQTIKKVVIPAALSGIVTACILGMMRAMGETMAVVMVMGNSQHIPTSILDTGYAMTSKILSDIGYYFAQPEPRAALFGIAVVLFLMEMGFVAVARAISASAAKRMQ